MANVSKIFLILLSILLFQNKAFSYEKNSGKVSVSVSVSKTEKSGDKSAEVKTGYLESKTVESNAPFKEDKSISKTAEIPSANNLSNKSSYSDEDNDKLFNGFYGNKFYKKFEIAKQERLFGAIKNFKNKENISEVDLEKLDNLVNKRIKEIAQKIKFKLDIDNEKQLFDFTKNASFNIDRIEKKAELVDYVQKTFEVMGLIN